MKNFRHSSLAGIFLGQMISIYGIVTSQNHQKKVSIKRKLIPLITVVCLMIFIFNVNAQTRNTNQIVEEKDKNLLEFAQIAKLRMEAEKAEAIRIAQEKGWIIKAELDDGSLIEIMRIDEHGIPEYNITNNLNAARTSETDHLWTGGVSGLNLDGSGMLIGEWDGGSIRTTHQEYGGRATQQDIPADPSWHSTHVAGTIIAQGVINSAHGMAPAANLDAYDWDNDESEMATAAAVDDLILSNHSYGRNRGWDFQNPNWLWFGTVSISTTEDYKFGFYGDLAHNWDLIANNAPHYLICKSAGNDRDDDHTGAHYYNDGTNWIYSTASRDPDGGTDGYDCIGNRGVAKNILTVGAVADIPAGYSNPANVIIEDYSGWGPTDDGRIKPDIVANGQSLYSTDDDSNSDYTWSGGTSMSTPTTTGTLALLQDYYDELHGTSTQNTFMSASALKGLIINTAHEAGPANGPDYTFGWGLLNATGAAELITEDDVEGGLIVEGTLRDNQTIYYTYYSDGSTDINVTLIWNDPAHIALTPSLNPTTITLVHDLDLLITDEASSYYSPWRLEPTSPASPATKNFNYRDNVETVNIISPAAGFYTIRINEYSTLSGGEQTYALIVNGLTTPPAESYCDVSHTSWSSFEYIKNVTMGDIDNSSVRSPGGHADFTGQVDEIIKGNSEPLSVTINGYSSDEAMAWVDWNQDGDFTDTGEDFYLGGGVGPYSTTITAPANALAGYTTMRIRLAYNTMPIPCGNLTYGETEDYTIKVIGTPGLWTGIVSSDWHNPANWDDGLVPTSTTPVSIPSSSPYSPVIQSGYAYCKSLSLNTGATLEQNTGSYFHCYGTFDAGYGQFTMSGLSYLYFNGPDNNVWWDDNQNDTYTYVRVEKENSTASMNMQNNMTCSGNFEIRKGIFSMNLNRTLTINNTGPAALEIEDDGKLLLNDVTKAISVDGDVHFLNGSQAEITEGTISCGGSFVVDANTSYDIGFTGGTLLMNGSSTQYINDLDGGMLDLYDLTINKSGGVCYIQSANLDINHNLLISSGTLSCNNGPSPTAVYHIYIAGDWINNAGDAGFDESTATVFINGGNYHQYCSDENFYGLNLAKYSGGAFRMNGTHVVCESYNWSAGAIDVLTGSFTANDLYDNGIFGSYYTNPGGIINLTNDAFVDLNGSFTLSNGGEIHVYGGSLDSYWPYSENASITMNAGIIDFHDQGIRIHDTPTYNFNDNITGGVIRTSQGLNGNRADFTPGAGTFELYGPVDYGIYQSNGCTFHHVMVNKSSDDSNFSPKLITISDEREKETPFDGSKASTTSLGTDIFLTGNLTIESGSLEPSGHQLDVANDVNVYGQLVMDNAADILNAGNEIIWHSGSTANASTGVINLDYRMIFNDGSNVQLSAGNTLNLIGTGATAIRNFSAVAEIGNLNVSMPPASGTCYISYSTTHPVHVVGNLNVATGNQLLIQEYDVIVDGEINIANTASVELGSSLGSGFIEGYGPFTLDGTLILDYDAKDKEAGFGNEDESIAQAPTIGANKSLGQDNTDWLAGEVLSHGHYTQNSTALLSIHGGGSFICDEPTTSGCLVKGTFNLNNGLFEISNNHLILQASCNVNGGTIRCGGTFNANVADNFQPTGGVVELIGNGSTGEYIQVHANNYFYNLTINRTNTLLIYTGYDLNIKNDFTILSGGLNTNARDMYVGGDWKNQVGTDAFLESTGKVTFNGPGPAMQYINSDEYFNILENNTFQAIRVNSVDDVVECNTYNWISGGVSVYLGTFIANDLTQSGLYGDWYALTESEIHLHQDGAQYIDLFGDVLIYGNGLIRVYGGQDESFWCTSSTTNIDISNGGIFDFVDFGITIWESFPLTYDLDGGIIRTGGHFTCRRNDFNPTGGNFEFYGGNDSYIDVYSGSDLENVIINKSGGDKSTYTYLDRDGKTQTGSKSNKTYLSNNDLYISGNLEVDAGTLDINQLTLSCYGNANVNNGGVLYVKDNSTLALDNLSELNVNNGGTLQTIASLANEAIITHISGYYDLSIESGGNINAEFTTFEYMSTEGVNLLPGSTVNTINSFNYCTFQNGQSGGTLMTVNNSETIDVNEAVFPTNTWGGASNVYKSVNSGTVNFLDAEGPFSGESYDSDPYNRINWEIPPISIDLTVFLEGPFDPTSNKMNTDLNSVLPTIQPYSPGLPYFGNATPDWYYGGSETVGAIPNISIVDWVIVQLREGTSASTATTVLASQAAFINNNGDIVGMDGVNPLSFVVSYTSNLYAVVWHRNHLGIISANPLINVGGVITYDFSSSSSKALGGISAQKQLASGTWGMISGDGDGSGAILLEDRNNVWNVQAGTMGYKASDYNMNKQVNNPDKNDNWLPNMGSGSFIPE